MTQKHTNTSKIRRIAVGMLTLAVFFAAFGPAWYANADEADELRKKIQSTESQIDEVNAEIARLEREIQQVGAERSTLQAAINELNLTKKKLFADISLTQKEIEKTSYTIQELEFEIGESERKIARNDQILANALRKVYEADDRSLIETVLANESLSELWLELDQMDQVQNTIQRELVDLRETKAVLQDQHVEENAEHQNLTAFKNKLSGQQRVIEENARAKSNLLAETKSKEAAYQELLESKRQARQEFESDLQDFEAQLTYVLDAASLPQKGVGALGWPVASPSVTQGYGLTSFALAGSYGYDKTTGQPNPHRGVDFRASVGTPLLSAAAGTVRDAVNMDATPGCYSYGKWILVDHDNGLSTLYAHLSVISVSPGQAVQKGEIIGYAGATGYATGPHLHFAVFDRSAVKVDRFSWSIGCKNAKIAYAPFEAYLNPFSYLPTN